MEIKRYILIQAVKLKDNTLIPIWDDKISFKKTEMYGNQIEVNGETYYDLVETVYDLKKKKLKIGIELNYYPPAKKIEYKIYENVLYDKGGRKLSSQIISDIVFEEYDLYIQKGRKIDKFWLNHFKDEIIDDNSLYAIKQWKPFYILDNGEKVEWEYKLYHRI